MVLSRPPTTFEQPMRDGNRVRAIGSIRTVALPCLPSIPLIPEAVSLPCGEHAPRRSQRV